MGMVGARRGPADARDVGEGTDEGTPATEMPRVGDRGVPATMIAIRRCVAGEFATRG